MRWRRHVVLALCGFSVVVCVACELLVGIPDVTLAPSDGGLVGLPDAATDGSSMADGRCRRSPMDGERRSGPEMVAIDSPLGSYCIDTTEVTIADFNAYLLDSGAHDETPGACDAAISPPFVNNDPSAQSLPVHGVGVCDAWSYCHWAGKRLCGAIGDGGSVRGVEPHATEWYYACVNGVANTAFPYGVGYDAQACNAEGAGPVAVGSKRDCRGMTAPFDRIYDMSGNAWEFVNDIGPTSLDSINAHGGSWGDGKGASCARLTGFNGFTFDFDQSGFRCCADSPP